MSTSTHHAPRRWAWWVALALALAAVGAYSIVEAIPSPPTPNAVLSRSTTSIVVKPSAFEHLASSHPMYLEIPSIDVKTALVPLGLQADGEVDVPTTTNIVGWYDRGPTPGQVGSAVMLGHVDSYLGPGTLFYLKNVKAGNTIIVKLKDGVIEHFVVTTVAQYAKTNFPDQLVYGNHGTRSLQIVTCGGVFDHATGHYESNVVVFSRLVSTTGKKLSTNA